MEEKFNQVLIIGGSRAQLSALGEEMRKRGLGEPVRAKKKDALSLSGDNARRVYVLGAALNSRQTIDLLDELRQRPCHAPVVVLRDEGERAFLIECFKHGAVEVLSGPVTAPDWSTRLGCWLSPRRTARSARSN